MSPAGTGRNGTGLAAAVDHLTPERWERANRLLIRKALAEFAHERLIAPEPAPGRARGRTRMPSAATTV